MHARQCDYGLVRVCVLQQVARVLLPCWLFVSVSHVAHPSHLSPPFPLLTERWFGTGDRPLTSNHFVSSYRAPKSRVPQHIPNTLTRELPRRAPLLAYTRSTWEREREGEGEKGGWVGGWGLGGGEIDMENDGERECEGTNKHP